MHLLLSAEDCEPFLLEELQRAFAQGRHTAIGPRLVAGDFLLQPAAPPRLVFSRQLLPNAVEQQALSISAWSEVLLATVIPNLPEGLPWRMQVVPHYGSGTAGLHRCRLIREATRSLLAKRRRRLLRTLDEDATGFAETHSLVQLLLVAPDRGWISVAPAPMPHRLRHLLWPFPKGEIPVANDQAAPCRAFAKLVEAELRLGCRIGARETCVDLGAAPGSWSYVALQRGAQVTAVDRAPLRADLMRHPRLTFRQADAFRYRPEQAVDWLLCDVIAAPDRSVRLLLEWAAQAWTRRFVVTIKFKGHGDYGVLESLKHALPSRCEAFFLSRLCANKNEACAFGVLRPPALDRPAPGIGC
jgi:23S rRNA (cytidine2498-2'-O)-methyltransferase